MAYSAINKSSSFFNTLLYTGTGATNAVTGVGFQPDLIWGKNRSATGSHNIVDSVRGTTKIIYTELGDAETTNVNSFNAFGADGFTVGTSATVNGSGNYIVSWNWKAGTTTALSGGTITPTAQSINTTSGFSIIKYGGNSTSGATLPHGLGVKPGLILIKRLTSTGAWYVYHKSLGATKYMKLNTGDTVGTSTGIWNDVEPTSTLITLGNDGDVNGSGETMIAYVFAEITGYSKFGIYTGNNNDNGPFLYTGFKPNFVMTKSSSAGEAWNIADKSRIYNVATAQIRNPKGYFLRPNNTNAESTAITHSALDLVSNGFKLRRAHGQYNGTETHIYIAFGQPIVSNSGVPATAR